MIAKCLESIDTNDAERMAEDFARDGYFMVRNGISREEAAELRAKTDYYALNPAVAAKHKTFVGDTFVLRYCHRLDPAFAALINAAERLRSVATGCPLGGSPSVGRPSDVLSVVA